mgnify:CR=1 FL=1
MIPDLASFARRSSEAEIIDDMTIDASVMSGVLADLTVINRYLGGYRTSLDALARVLPRDARTARVLDVGAGGGDMARRLVAWGASRGIRVGVVAVDLSAAAARYAHERVGDRPGISVVQGSALALPFAPEAFDAVHCALFLHHFDDAAIADLVRAMVDASRYGVVVNDLHRHPLAYAGIWTLTRLLGATRIVQNDAPLSVRRAFTRDDLERLARATGLPFEVTWRWAFRYQLVIRRRPPGSRRDDV